MCEQAISRGTLAAWFSYWSELAGGGREVRPQAAACEVCNQTVSKEGGGGKDFAWPSELVPAGRASASSQKPTIAASVLRSGGACAREPSGRQSWVLGCRRVVQALLSSGKAARSLIGWDGPGVARGYRRFPHHFQCECFLFSSIPKSPSARFWISLGGNCCICGCTFGVHMGDRKVSIFLRCLLGSESHQCSFSEP